MGLLYTNAALSVQRRQATTQKVLVTPPYTGNVWIEKSRVDQLGSEDWPIVPLEPDVVDGAQFKVWFDLDDTRNKGFIPEPGDVFTTTGSQRGKFMPISSPVPHASGGPLDYLEVYCLQVGN